MGARWGEVGRDGMGGKKGARWGQDGGEMWAGDKMGESATAVKLAARGGAGKLHEDHVEVPGFTPSTGPFISTEAPCWLPLPAPAWTSFFRNRMQVLRILPLAGPSSLSLPACIRLWTHQSWDYRCLRQWLWTISSPISSHMNVWVCSCVSKCVWVSVRVWIMITFLRWSVP